MERPNGRASQKIAVCLMWFSTEAAAKDFISFEEEVTKLKCKS